MVKIRLARHGKKKQPTYRLVVSDARKDTLGTYIENLGSYNPSVNPKQIVIDAERVKHWLSVGAQPSPSVHNLLINEGIIEGEKVKNSRHKAKAKAETADETKAVPDAAKAEPLTGAVEPLVEVTEAKNKQAKEAETPEAPAEEKKGIETKKG